MRERIRGTFEDESGTKWWALNDHSLAGDTVHLSSLTLNHDNESYHQVSAYSYCECTLSEFKEKYTPIYVSVIDVRPAIEHCYDLAGSKSKKRTTGYLCGLKDSQLLRVVKHDSDTALSRCAKAHAMDELWYRGLAEFDGKKLVLK